MWSSQQITERTFRERGVWRRRKIFRLRPPEFNDRPSPSGAWQEKK